MSKKTRYVLPEALVPEGSKTIAGDDFNQRMTGAYYGSSYEFNIVGTFQLANGKDRQCPAHAGLIERLKPKYSYGEFGAFKVPEYQEITQMELGRFVVELPTVEDIKLVRQSVDRMIEVEKNAELKKLSYVSQTGQRYTLSQLKNLQKTKVFSNNEIQRQKDKFLLENNLAVYKNDKGEEVHPIYPRWALDEISRLNDHVWTPTGVNLQLKFTGIHTIAKDSKYFGGHLKQQELDALSAQLNYKECTTFYKGVVRSGRVTIPIQSLEQLKLIKSWLENIGTICMTEWPDKVKSTAVKLEKIKIK